MSIRFDIRELQRIKGLLLEQCIELLIETVEDGASIGFLAPVSIVEAQAYWEQAIEPGVRLWGAFNDRKLVGSVQLHLSQKSNGKHRAEIAKLMVHPHYRRQGMARALLDAAHNAAHEEGRTLLVLDTREGDPSNALYLSAGYQEAGRIPDFALSSDGNYHSTVFYYKRLERK